MTKTLRASLKHLQTLEQVSALLISPAPFVDSLQQALQEISQFCGAPVALYDTHLMCKAQYPRDVFPQHLVDAPQSSSSYHVWKNHRAFLMVAQEQECEIEISHTLQVLVNQLALALSRPQQEEPSKELLLAYLQGKTSWESVCQNPVFFVEEHITKDTSLLLAQAHDQSTIQHAVEQAFPKKILASFFTDTLYVAIISAEPLRVEMIMRNKVLGVRIGISSCVHTPKAWPIAYQEALQALTLGARAFKDDPIVTSERLGIYKFLNEISEETPQAFQPYIPIFQQLATEDQHSLTLLECWLGQQRNVNATALAYNATTGQQLHRNTIKQRLDRVRATFHAHSIDIMQEHHRTLMLVALAYYRLNCS